MRYVLFPVGIPGGLRGYGGDVLFAMGDGLDPLRRELQQQPADLIEGQLAPVLEHAQEEKAVQVFPSVAGVPSPRIGAGQKPFVYVIANGTGAETGSALKLFEGVFPGRHGVHSNMTCLNGKLKNSFNIALRELFGHVTL